MYGNGETPSNLNLKDDENTKKLKSENKIIKLQEDEYELEMSLYNNNIEFKVIQNSPMASCYYKEKYTYEEIKKISYIYNPKYKDIESIYQYYKEKILLKKEINLILSEDKNIMCLKYQIISNDDEIDVDLQLKKFNLEKHDIDYALMKEVEKLKKECQKNEKIISELKKNNDLLMEEFNKMKEKEKEEEKRKIEEEKEEERRKIEEEELSKLNDNLNLKNNFQVENFQELKNIDVIFSEKLNIKCVAVYCIIKNNERLYQMAYPKYKSEQHRSDIIIYNLILNKIENKIIKADNYEIVDLKHYFDCSTKNHILLSSSSHSIKLWNISSNTIINILEITNKYIYKPCLMFKNEDFLIFGFDSQNNRKMSVWDKRGNYKKSINKSGFNYGLNFIESTLLENKSYILLSGYNYDQNTSKSLYYSECYNYDEGDIKSYKDDENNSCIYCINLFKKENKIYLITGSNEKVNIFDFYTTKLKTKIQLGSNYVYSLCSLNEKYIIASNSYKLKIINMETISVEKEYSAHNDGKEYDIKGIEKIKIPEKGELIITYSNNYIKVWKI